MKIIFDRKSGVGRDFARERKRKGTKEKILLRKFQGRLMRWRWQLKFAYVNKKFAEQETECVGFTQERMEGLGLVRKYTIVHENSTPVGNEIGLALGKFEFFRVTSHGSRKSTKIHDCTRKFHRAECCLHLESRRKSVVRFVAGAGWMADLKRRAAIMADANKSERVNVLGVGLSAINLKLALQAVGGALAKKSKGYVCVTGVHGVMEAQKDERLRSILNQAFLNTPDGMPMVWVGRLNGHREMDRVYGPDLMLLVCEYARDNGYSHFLYGGGEGVAEELQRKLEAKFPGIKIVGTYTPPFRPLNETEEAEMVSFVNGKKPDIIWVGLSTPKQEKFMAQYRGRLDATLMFGVGAAFDFHAGRVRQAPRWMQRSGLEWFFRLGCEPRRLWRRYLRNNPLFVFRMFCQWTGLKKYALE